MRSNFTYEYWWYDLIVGSILVEMDGEKKDDTDPGQDAPIQKTASDSDIEQDPGELGPLIHTTFEGVSETAYEGVVEGI